MAGSNKAGPGMGGACKPSQRMVDSNKARMCPQIGHKRFLPMTFPFCAINRNPYI